MPVNALSWILLLATAEAGAQASMRLAGAARAGQRQRPVEPALPR